jgi:ABC-type uncharacterized transport system permease subunit
MSAAIASGGLLFATLAVAVVRSTTPILFAALGGLVSELAGCINVALEGLMLLAAFFAVIGAWYFGRYVPGAAPWACACVGCAAGLLAAVLGATVLAAFHLEWGADLIVAGIAINILAEGLTVFLLVSLVGDKGSTASISTPALPSIRLPGLHDSPALDTLMNGADGLGHHVLIYVAVLCAAALPVLLARTRFGLRLRAVGESPAAARNAGIAVKRMRYVALLLSGLLAGLGGVYLSLGYLTLFQAGMSAGRGFTALAVVFLGARRPLGTIAAAVLFGACAVLSTELGAMGMSIHLVAMVPPAITICTLVIAGWSRIGPRVRSTPGLTTTTTP